MKFPALWRKHAVIVLLLAVIALAACYYQPQRPPGPGGEGKSVPHLPLNSHFFHAVASKWKRLRVFCKIRFQFFPSVSAYCRSLFGTFSKKWPKCFVLFVNCKLYRPVG